jgi:hypothetical protein
LRWLGLARSTKVPIRRVRRVPLIEIGTPYEDAPLFVGLDPDALCGEVRSADGPLLPIRRLKQLFYGAVERHQRCAQPSLK